MSLINSILTGVHKQFLGFVIVGGIAAAANVGSRMVFSRWLTFPPAIILAYIVGMIVAFMLNRLFVFRKTVNPLHRQAFWFTIVNLVAVAETLIVSLLLVDIVFPHIGFRWHTETVSHTIGVMAPIVTSFFGHQKLTFRID